MRVWNSVACFTMVWFLRMSDLELLSWCIRIDTGIVLSIKRKEYYRCDALKSDDD
jgi:hypothetical protein